MITGELKGNAEKLWTQKWAGGKSGLKEMILRAARALLPSWLLYELWHLKSKRVQRPILATGSDVRVLEPQTGVLLKTYWTRNPGVGAGPSASLFVLDEEILRLDCFGGTDGHMHFNPVQAHLTSGRPPPRIRFQPASIPQQIERAVFELLHNARAAKSSNMLWRVRKFQLQQDALDRAAVDMAAHMKALYQAHGAQ